MRTISYETLKRNLSCVFNGVADDGRTVAVRWKGRKVVMIRAAEWSGLTETVHLLSAPKNAHRPLDASARAASANRRGKNSSKRSR
jgi:PHD/YefM family antitoxin component YafN of YafNO toxin-antitoxin module